MYDMGKSGDKKKTQEEIDRYNKMSGAKKENFVSADDNPDREMMMDEFMEGIVRMGVRRYRLELGLHLGASTQKVSTGGEGQ